MKAKIQDGVNTLNQVVEQVALPWMKMSKKDIMTTFAAVFCHLDAQLVLHLISKFQSDKDFARFYLNMDMKVTRQVFEYYSVPLEPDKYPDEQDRIKKQLAGVSKWEIFPFERQIVNQFYLMAFNNSLQLLKNISPDAYNHVVKRKIDLFGNGKNWSKAWSVFTDQEKEAVVSHLLTTKF
ncbi:MAG: hypothetical protein LBS20_10965 [Prevotella sp.]|jgi:hypothetical protein|nr:hypothetical protein [Prevotella sp.]